MLVEAVVSELAVGSIRVRVKTSYGGKTDADRKPAEVSAKMTATRKRWRNPEQATRRIFDSYNVAYIAFWLGPESISRGPKCGFYSDPNGACLRRKA